MAQVDLSVTNEQISSITTPEVRHILTTIKQIQKRMRDPDVAPLEYIRVYDKLGKEFDDFFTRYTGIFVKVVKGDDLSVLASALYYKDQVARGLVQESELADLLAKKYFSPSQKEESDRRLQEMREKKEI
jgi:hypothetical protein